MLRPATLASNGSPPITRTTFPSCRRRASHDGRAHYPGGSSGCSCRLLPHSCCLPQMAGGSASALSLSRPAQALLTLRPAGSLSRPRRPLSRGSNPCSCLHKPLVSYRTNRQLSVWNLPPLMIRAFAAHCHHRTNAVHQELCSLDYFIGGGLDTHRRRKTEHLCSLEIDDELEFHRLLNRQVSRRFAFENPRGVATSEAIGIHLAGSIAHQSTNVSKLAQKIDCRHRMTRRQPD